MRLSPLAAISIAALVLANIGCEAISDLLPTLPSKAGSLPKALPTVKPNLPTLRIPTVLPTPKPTPVPTPTPVSTPEPPPTGSSCSLPASNPANPACTFDPARLEGDVEAAMTQVTQSHPQYFNFKDTRCGNCYLVLDIDGYIREVQRALAGRGVCSYWDGEELAVKDSNAASEQYDVLLASNHMRRAPGAYRGVCRPSWF